MKESVELKHKRGVVVSLNFSGGYGIISGLDNVDEIGKEYFFHATDIKNEKGVAEEDQVELEDINTGDIVRFIPFEGKKGWKALGVEVEEK